MVRYAIFTRYLANLDLDDYRRLWPSLSGVETKNSATLPTPKIWHAVNHTVQNVSAYRVASGKDSSTDFWLRLTAFTLGVCDVTTDARRTTFVQCP